MSKGRELALLEKWADAAGATLPPTSPTSPKATKFCCCPNRRRYHIKQPKKSTLHARNIFLDNDFSFIDDVSSPLHNSNNTNPNNRSSSSNTGSDSTDTGHVAAAKTSPTVLANNCGYEVIDSAADSDGSRSATLKVSGSEQQPPQAQQQQSRRIEPDSQWRHDKRCHNHSNNGCDSNTNANEHSHGDNSCSCSCPEQPAAASTPTVGVQYPNCEKSPSLTNTTEATNTTTATTIGHITNDRVASGNDRASAAALAQTIKQQQQEQQQQEYDGNEARNECRSNNNNNNNNKSKNSDQQIQRLRNSEFNCSNNKEENNISCNNNNSNSNNKSNNNSEPCNCRLDSSTDSSAATHDERCNSSESCRNNSNRDSSANDSRQCNSGGNKNNDDDDDDNNVADDKIDLQNKMTITTTNAASRKRVECGLTSATTTTTTTAAAATEATRGTMPATTEAAPTAGQAAMTMPTTKATTATPLPTTAAARPTTPSLTTVIKTTMVKRSPSNETASPCASPTAKDANAAMVTAILSKFPLNADNALYNNANNNNISNSNKCDEITEPTPTIKQRIAALVAGNEQTKNHDNSIKSPMSSCNSNSSSKHQSNMTTQAKSAINSLHYKQPLISSKCPTATNTTTTTASSGTTATALTEALVPATPSNVVADVAAAPHRKSGLSDVQRASLPATAATGYATMPRRRSPAERHGNAVRCGSISAAMTGDKKFLNDGGGSGGAGGALKLPHGDMANGATDTCRKRVSTLDNLDLALKHDWTDDDGEDSYSAFQDYLEKVEHEINEVFEMRKARQRAMQESLDAISTPAPSTASNDELSRSIEYDSGCGSASGQQISGDGSSSSSDSGCAHAKPTTTPISSSEVPLITVDRTPTTTQLLALPPPPLGLGDNVASTSAAAATLRRRQHVPHDASGANNDTDANNEDVNVWAKKFLRDLDNLMSSSRPLSLSACSSPTSKTSPLLLSAAATAAIQSRYGKCAAAEREHCNGLVLRPEKHTTIPLQSFNLDCGHLDNGGSNNDNNNDSNNSSAAKPTVAYMRTLSAPTPYHQQPLLLDNKSPGGGIGSDQSERNSLAAFTATLPPHQQHYHNLTNLQQSDGATSATASPPNAAATTILKIEETAAGSAKRPQQQQQQLAAATATASVHDIDEESFKCRRQRQLDNDMETMRGARLSPSQSHSCRGSSGSDKNTLVASTMATSLPKRERINHATTTSTTMTMTTTAGPTKTATAPTTGNAAALLPSTLLTSSKANSGGGGSVAAGSLLLNGSDATKKGSTSTIWTSEESILRSVGAVDEDNNSTSSSACEEASGVLSSGKSGISLDSSGLDNDNNESGIGTATPPKDISYWKSAHNDNESVSSLDALRKMKFQKSSSVASSDDPDLLEVLSLCDEPHGDEDIGDDVDESHDDIEERQSQQLSTQQQQRPHQQQQQLSAADKQQKQLPLPRPSRHRHRPRQQLVDSTVGNETLEAARHGHADDIDLDEEDEGHDEFETVPFYDCDCNDGDASSASGSGTGTGGSRAGSNAPGESSAVLLRRKLNGTPLLVPPKCRSHSLDTATLPSAYYHHYHHQHQHQHPHQHQHQHQHAHPPLTRKLQHLQGRTKERGQLSLTLRQEPFTSLLSPTQFNELPSPSSASLHSGHESLGIQELTTKSNSAPLLLKQEKKRDDFAGQKSALRYSRSQSDRYLAEIEAVESCKWLRAAGFPQYAQMYEDHQFPIDLASVAKDHTNLENDQLQSLYRRLCILNRCANMRIDQSHKAQTPQQKEDSDDENFALSENWTFQPHIRRWSRIGEMGLEIPPAGQLNIEKTESSSKESSPDRFEDDQYDMSTAALALNLPGEAADSTLNDSGDSAGVRLRRTGSERFKDGAKAFLRRVESIKSRRRKRQNREGMVISGPQALDLSQLGQRNSARKPDAVYSTPPSPSAVSPMHTFPKGPMFGNELKVPSQSETYLSPNRASPKRTPTTPRSMRTSPLHFFSNPMPHLREGKSDDSSSYYSDSQESSTGGKLALRKTPSKTRRFLQRTGKVDDIGAHSDSECHQGRKLLIKDANSNTTEVKIKKLTRGGSLNLGKDPKKREGFRSASVRSRSTSRKESKTEETDNVKRAPVVRWHSFQMEERPHMIFRKCFSQKIEPSSKDRGIPFAAMSAGQLQILRKLALVILTGQMENHCPSHRSGWNWELPKFIKKIKMPDYKDKKVFGVPLLLVLQRTGQTLPVAIRAAFRWLQVRALDQVGLFRKSGVKSRIIKLKADIENLDSTTQCMEVFDMQQAYDVADMLKQYFRDLPESLLTTKMSETFATIFQHLPKDVRLEAVQCAVLLLPDENREILYALLEFLTLVAANAEYNQMTANNLAVCLAPSLFHSSISTGTTSVSASPRRRKGAGVPDDKELLEAKASHECLAFMIENYKQIYTASKEKINKCNFGYMEESKPVPLEALGEGMQFHNWRGYLYECTSATIKEGREKTRGWITVTSSSDGNVDIAYKKVGDGHPLRLWRCITEVEGPPKEVLDYIIKQRASWDPNLLECQTVKKLDERTEIFQYAMDGQFTTDFCVLRSWQMDLPRGACVIVETSIDHGKAKPMFGAVRGVVLASRYLIEPCGSGRSRVMHLARVDIKGRSPEWYNRSYGHICSHYLSRIRLAFKNVTEGPESKV